jgi:hypothetical protein
MKASKSVGTIPADINRECISDIVREVDNTKPVEPDEVSVRVASIEFLMIKARSFLLAESTAITTIYFLPLIGALIWSSLLAKAGYLGLRVNILDK